MKKINKLTLMITSLLLVMVSVFNVIEPREVDAEDQKKIVDSLEIINKKDPYYPGQDIYLKGKWSLPNDNPEKEYKAGDTFSLTIPEGLEPNFKEISLGEMGKGLVVGNEIVFTFNENIEDLINREGGFNLTFKVKEPVEEAIVDLPLEIKDQNSNLIFKDTITIDNEAKEIHTGDRGVFSKASYIKDGEFRWYVYINRNGELTGDTLHLSDTLDYNQKIRPGTLEVRRYPKTEPGEAEGESVKVETNLKYHPNDKGFEVDLDISEGHWYHIEYEIEYIGGYDNPDADDNGMLTLKNKAVLTSPDQGLIPHDNNNDDNTALGEFNIGGWAQGFEQYGKMVVKKVDAITEKAVGGASFRLTNKKYPSQVYEFTVDENGIAELEDVYGGLYLLEEIYTPEGYIPLAPQEVLIRTSEDVFTLNIENDPKPIQITGEKKWIDEENNPIEPQQAVIIQLYANSKLIRQKVVSKNESTFTFDNLAAYDEDGNKIDYSVSERTIEGYEVTITQNNNDFTVVNKKLPQDEFIDIYVQKTWKNHLEEEIDPIKDIELKLLANGTVIEERTVSIEQQKSLIAFTDLPKQDNGSDIQYEVIEVIEDTFESDMTVDHHGIWQITNTVKPVSIKGRKTWINKQGQSINPVQPIEIILYQNDVAIESITIDTNTSDFEFNDLVAYDQAGKKIEYHLKETEIDDFYASILFDNTTNTWEITNNERGTSLSIEKFWFDKDGNATAPAREITINLLANDQVIDTKTFDTSMERYTFESLAKYDCQGNIIDYSIEEVALDGFESDIHYDTIHNIWNIENRAQSTSIKGNKVWLNRQGEEISAVGPIEVILLANNQEQHRLRLDKNTYDFVFVNLDKYDQDGNLIEYTIEEVGHEDFIPSILFNTNTDRWEIANNGQGVSIHLQKQWFDKNNRPIEGVSDVVFSLYANDQKVDEITLNKNESSYSFDGLAKYDYRGEIIKYTIKEEPVLGFESSVTYDQTSNTFHVKNTQKSTTISGNKVWRDQSGQSISSVGNVDIILLANDVEIDRYRLDRGNYEFVFDDLDIYDDVRNEIIYTIAEEGLADFTSSINYNPYTDQWNVANNGMDKQVVVEKRWLDENNEELSANMAVEFELFANNEIIETKELDTTNTLLVFDHLPKYDYYGDKIHYHVKEKDILGFDSHGYYDDAKDVWIFDNKVKTQEIRGSKKWLNHKGNMISAVSDVEIILWADNVEVDRYTLRKGETEFKFENLRIYDDSQQEIEYHLSEINHPAFSEAILYNHEEKVCEITNNQSTVDISLSKKWVDKDGTLIRARSDIELILLANDQEYERITLNKNESSYVFENLPKFDFEGNEIEYQIQEEPVSGFESHINYDADSQHWDIVNVEVSTEILGEKVWLNHQAEVIESPENVDFLLYADGELVERTTLQKGETQFRFDNLSTHDAEGNKITYHIEEEGSGDFYSSILYNPLTNKVEVANNDKGTQFRIVKEWQNSDGEIIQNQGPAVFKLYANNQHIDTITLNKGENEYIFTDLAKYSFDGSVIDYHIEEVDVEGYTSTISYDDLTKTATVINKEKPVTIRGSKAWIDESGQAVASREDVEIELYANDKLVDSQILERGAYELSFENMPRFEESGSQIEYKIKEQESENFVSDVFYDDDHDMWLLANNKKSISVKGEKIWRDVNHKTVDKEIPYTIHLKANDEIIASQTLTTSTFEFDNLPYFNYHGQKIHYTVVEEELEGYDSKVFYDVDLKQWLVINSEIPVTISGEKQWFDASKNQVESKSDITLELKAHGITTNKMILTKDETQFSFDNLPRFDRFGNHIEYSVREMPVTGFKTEIEKTHNHFIIKNVEDNIPVIDNEIRVSKEWRDVNNNEIDPVKDIEIILKANQEIIDRKKIAKNGENEVIFTDLASKDEHGNSIQYQIEELGDKDFVTSINYEKDHVKVVNRMIDEPNDVTPEVPATGVITGYKTLVGIIVMSSYILILKFKKHFE